jgi:hypothetical protein
LQSQPAPKNTKKQHNSITTDHKKFNDMKHTHIDHTSYLIHHSRSKLQVRTHICLLGKPAKKLNSSYPLLKCS